jgi:hypothetical protein
MRRCELFALHALLLASACNSIFDVRETGLYDAAGAGIDAEIPPDRDRDGIPDPDDPCIASIADPMADYDGDSFPNGTDGCPFDYEQADGDGDGVYDECDPLETLPGETRRCVMAFQNPTITRELLRPRPADIATWNLLGLSGISGVGTGTLVSVEHFEAPVTTLYDLVVYGGFAMSPTPAGVTLWLRTNATVSASDVGCQLRGDASSTTLTLLGATPAQTVTIPKGFQRGWKLEAIIEPSVTTAPNVRCSAREPGATTRSVLAAQIALPAGTPGLGIEAAQAMFGGLLVLERSDTPPL